MTGPEKDDLLNWSGSGGRTCVREAPRKAVTLLRLEHRPVSCGTRDGGGRLEGPGIPKWTSGEGENPGTRICPSRLTDLMRLIGECGFKVCVWKRGGERELFSSMYGANDGQTTKTLEERVSRRPTRYHPWTELRINSSVSGRVPYRESSGTHFLTNLTTFSDPIRRL